MNYKLLTMNKTMLRIPLALSVVAGLMIMLGCTDSTIAQKSEVFKVDGKEIDVKDFNKTVSHIMDEMGVPGMSLAIIDDNQIVFSKGYGLRRKGPAEDAGAVRGMSYGYSVKDLKLDQPVDKGTTFNGASLSKTFLAFVAYQLADEGKLDLDKPMYEYMENDRLAHDERYKQITTRMVLSHSSGLENWSWQNDRSKLEILYTPGEAYVYSGEGYNYLALITKQILDEGYEDYVGERVIDRLGLENSYLKYNELQDTMTVAKSIPSNFAAGHPLMGGQYLIRNTYVNPAFANHFSAEDYAKLIVSMFNTSHLSKERRHDLLEPRVKKGNSSVYYGPAFELVFNEGDTIISHGGDNPGFKNLVFYSPVKKRGFVMMVNSDIGNSMASKLNELSVNLDIDKFLSPKHALLYALQYPDPALGLLKTFQSQDSAAMFSALEALKSENIIKDTSFNAVAAFFLWYGNGQIGFKLLEYAVSMFPDSAITHTLLGEYYMNDEKYKLALDHLNKSKALNFNLWDIEDSIKQCEEGLSSPK